MPKLVALLVSVIPEGAALEVGELALGSHVELPEVHLHLLLGLLDPDAVEGDDGVRGDGGEGRGVLPELLRGLERIDHRVNLIRSVLLQVKESSIVDVDSGLERLGLLSDVAEVLLDGDERLDVLLVGLLLHSLDGLVGEILELLGSSADRVHEERSVKSVHGLISIVDGGGEEGAPLDGSGSSLECAFELNVYAVVSGLGSGVLYGVSSIVVVHNKGVNSLLVLIGVVALVLDLLERLDDIEVGNGHDKLVHAADAVRAGPVLSLDDEGSGSAGGNALEEAGAKRKRRGSLRN
mmetsp:Transcript_14256/g.29138  ORF Transcript_14256/g.29138 Transcript_14256/m.29138 type:complete len:294 (+) Transcript_14256:1104-1985(+)